jgi:hypothetical protein
MRANCLAEKGKELACTAVSEPRAVATGPKLNLEIALMLNDTNHDPLNLAPVATAPGSDTGLKHFCAMPGGTT